MFGQGQSPIPLGLISLILQLGQQRRAQERQAQQDALAQQRFDLSESRLQRQLQLDEAAAFRVQQDDARESLVGPIAALIGSADPPSVERGDELLKQNRPFLEALDLLPELEVAAEGEFQSRRDEIVKREATEPFIDIFDPNSPTLARRVPRSVVHREKGQMSPTGLALFPPAPAPATAFKATLEADSGLRPKTLSDLEAQIIASRETLVSLNQVADTMIEAGGPEILSAVGRGLRKYRRALDWLSLASDAQKVKIFRDQVFRQNAAQVILDFVGGKGGKTLTKTEIDFIKRAMVDVEGQSPTVFTASLVNSMQKIELGLVRLQQIRDKGLRDPDFAKELRRRKTLDAKLRIMTLDDAAQEFGRQERQARQVLRQRNEFLPEGERLSEEEIRAEVKDRLLEYYGIGR